MPSVAELYKLDLPMWQIDSACAGMDPEMWVGDNTSPKRAETAKAICAECPVIETCKDWVLQQEKTQGSIPGIYGGLTDRERRDIRICRQENCTNTVQKLNTKPRAQNNFCSEECRQIQIKLTNKKCHENKRSQELVASEYYMRGSIRNGKGSAYSY